MFNDGRIEKISTQKSKRTREDTWRIQVTRLL